MVHLHEMRPDCKSKKSLEDLIQTIDGSNLVMVEIGSYAGSSSKIFAESGRFQKIVCIDPWVTDPHGDNRNSYTDMENVERAFDEMASQHPQIIKHKGTIDTFIQTDLFRSLEGKIDFVYIDGLHTYEGCRNDIQKTLDFLKPDIAIGGHDFADYPPHVQGVKKSVVEFFQKPDKQFVDTSWIVFLDKEKMKIA